MNALWSYFWPALGAGLAVGVLAGAVAFRRRQRRNLALAGGVLLSIGLSALWHGPLGAADKFAASVDSEVWLALVNNEIPQVAGHIQHGPLTRRVFLSGPADDFQRSQLETIIGDLPGVSDARWTDSKGGVPLIVEGGLVAVLGFLFGLLLAYLVELRRQYNSQWKW